MKKSDSSSTNFYPIGKPGIAWGDSEKKEWLAAQAIQRSYQDDVVKALDELKQDFDVEQYGELNYEVGCYPLFAVKTKAWDAAKPTVLVTGGVHGYETSGVHGALRFLSTCANDFSEQFNIVVAPCVSPWGYETINRWNPLALDPNRSFKGDGSTQESSALIAYLRDVKSTIIVHIDLHETTDTDNSEFRPALGARDGIEQDHWDIPDGFYLVGNSTKPAPEFQRAIINEVRKITHIAPADNGGRIIGVAIEQEGVINYEVEKLGLCAGFTDAAYTTTTEVYPDSSEATPEQCILAQVAAVTGGLTFLLKPDDKN